MKTAEHRINLDLYQWTQTEFKQKHNLHTDFNSITVPTKALFVRGVQVFNSINSYYRMAKVFGWRRRDQTFMY